MTSPGLLRAVFNVPSTNSAPTFDAELEFDVAFDCVRALVLTCAGALKLVVYRVAADPRKQIPITGRFMYFIPLLPICVNPT
jgi:hypothetical protein